jgi:hypothetical protein
VHIYFIDVFLVENHGNPSQRPRRILSLGECRELELHLGDALGELETLRFRAPVETEFQDQWTSVRTIGLAIFCGDSLKIRPKKYFFFFVVYI